MTDRETLLKILDLARWAPSGDNTQPWRFEIVSDNHIAVHGHDTREWCVYDFRGHASHIAHGALLETLCVAASGFGCRVAWTLRQGTSDTVPIYDVSIIADADVTPDILLPFIETRVVQRRPMRLQQLEDGQRRSLNDAVGDEYTVRFFESFSERWKFARLLWANARLRLTCKEAYEVHKEVIEWGAQYSQDRIPQGAVGVDPATARLMRWVMQKWERVVFFNTYLLGTVPPRLQLDVLPAMACSAHVLVTPKHSLENWLDYVHSGEVMQRLWLTATSVGLHLQPEMTPVIFRWYCHSGDKISTQPEIDAAAAVLAEQFENVTRLDKTDAFTFFCRVGVSSVPRSRSTRLPVESLLISTM